MRFVVESQTKSAALIVCLLSGCLGDPDPKPPPISVAGTYVATLASGANGCQFANNNPGTVTSGINITAEQVKENVRITVMDGAGLILYLSVGSNLFEGTIDDTNIVLELHGNVQHMLDACSYKINATMTLDASEENKLDGEISYTVFTAGDPDCAELEGCSTVQTVTALRDTRIIPTAP